MSLALCCKVVNLLLCFGPALWCYQGQFSCEETCRDPSHWVGQFPNCGGLRQSPINIVTGKAHVNSALTPLTFLGHNEPINITVDNIGTSAHFSLPQSVRLSGGALPGHYRAANFHFHWGHELSPGSEHTLNGERLPMEMHIVHIKEPYGSLAEAEHDVGGIALLSFLFEESADDHVHLDTVIEALGRVQGNEMVNFRLSDIVPSAAELHSYYRYVGSMTTPGCEQSVAWTVFQKSLPISSRQVPIVSKCRFWTGKPMVDNFRPTQPLDGRVVYKSNLGNPLLSFSPVCYVLLLAILYAFNLLQH
uniref:Carbonic anhydrase IV c n=1 Tax=Neogobius melanostomus TaxID=47308 RepID=A0A8C6SPS1_9GOBI